MSELITTSAGTNIRLHMLATVSALSLLTVAATPAFADSADRPTVWIELGGQLERISSPSQSFAPDFIGKNADSPAFQPASPLQSQRSPRYAKGFDGTLTFQPSGSDWSVSAAILYGRANGNKEVHQQTAGILQVVPGIAPGPSFIKNYSNTLAEHRESHAVLDFKVGKDVGFGIFGTSGATTIDMGVRFAQFSARTNVDLRLRPEIKMKGLYQFKYWHTYGASLDRSASFHGIGPSLSLNNTANLVGDADDGGLSFDWGVNAAVLFGRQKVAAAHTTSSRYFRGPLFAYTPGHSQDHATRRSRSVVVPNLGGFAGLSVRYAAAKFSLGYRADFFLGAMDTGIDRRKTENMSFHGPFARVSIGLGG